MAAPEQRFIFTAIPKIEQPPPMSIEQIPDRYRGASNLKVHLINSENLSKTSCAGFYYQLVDEDLVLEYDKLHNDINALYGKVVNCHYAKLPLMDIRNGYIACAFVSSSKSFKRVKILQNYEGDIVDASVTCSLIDEGEEQKIAIENLYPLAKSFGNLPYQTLFFGLHDLIYYEKLGVIKTIIKELDLTGEMTIEIVSYNKNIPMVTLVSPKYERCLNYVILDKLIDVHQESLILPPAGHTIKNIFISHARTSGFISIQDRSSPFYKHVHALIKELKGYIGAQKKIQRSANIMDTTTVYLTQDREGNVDRVKLVDCGTGINSMEYIDKGLNSQFPNEKIAFLVPAETIHFVLSKIPPQCIKLKLANISKISKVLHRDRISLCYMKNLPVNVLVVKEEDENNLYPQVEAFEDRVGVVWKTMKQYSINKKLLEDGMALDYTEPSKNVELSNSIVANFDALPYS